MLVQVAFEVRRTLTLDTGTGKLASRFITRRIHAYRYLRVFAEPSLFWKWDIGNLDVLVRNPGVRGFHLAVIGLFVGVSAFHNKCFPQGSPEAVGVDGNVDPSCWSCRCRGSSRSF